jgi:hypothetical protein
MLKKSKIDNDDPRCPRDITLIDDPNLAHALSDRVDPQCAAFIIERRDPNLTCE